MKQEFERTYLIAPIEYGRVLRLSPFVRFLEQYYTHISDIDEEKYLKITNLQNNIVTVKHGLKETKDGQRYEDKQDVPVEEYENNMHRKIGDEIVRRLLEYKGIGIFLWLKPFANFVSAEVEFDSLEEMKSFVFPFKAIEVTENPFFRSKNIALKPKDTLREINRLFDIETKKYM